MKSIAALRAIAILSTAMGLLCLTACARHQASYTIPVYPPLPVVFASPNAVFVGEVADGQEWPVAESAWGKEGEGHLLLLLSKCGGLHPTPSPAQHDFLLTVLELNGKLVAGPEATPPVYDYISKTGEIGAGNRWYFAPAEFRVGMLKVKSRLPRHQPTKVVNLRGATIIVPK